MDNNRNILLIAGAGLIGYWLYNSSKTQQQETPATSDQINNPIANQASNLIKAGQLLPADLLKSLFSSGGVSPSFFENFQFLKFLDNSTDQWKSRFAMMKNWDANKRISWYIDKINKDSNPRDAIQYAELYGTIFRQIDDRHSVNYDFAKVFNDLVLFKFLKGNSNAIVPMSGYKGTEILCDLSAALKGSIGKINHGGSNSLSIFLL